jgi:hypothetical protein
MSNGNRVQGLGVMSFCANPTFQGFLTFISLDLIWVVYTYQPYHCDILSEPAHFPVTFKLEPFL